MSHSVAVQQIENILQHLESFLPLANAHMVDYFTKNIYFQYIPEDIRKEAECYGYRNVIEAIHNQQTQHLPKINNFIKKCHSLSLKSTSSPCISFKVFQNKLKQMNSNDERNTLKFKKFMTEKKAHEVELLSWIASAMKEITNVTHIVDIGDGRGYLSSMLALQYKIPVLGVDASQMNTESAVDRARKLSKVWYADMHCKEDSQKNDIKLYKQITKFVNEDIDFCKLISTHFQYDGPEERIGFVGLHTCGNLAPTCLKIFNKNQHAKMICNVGCCYHFLQEEFVAVEQSKDSFPGFPISKLLRNRKVALGRSARMIAAQSIDRIIENKEYPNNTIFYRAIFEIIIEKFYKINSLDDKQVGRFRKPINSFTEYVRKAAKRINLDVHLTDLELEEIYQNYDSRHDEMNLFFMLRLMVAPIIEAVILLDRLLFLIENGHDNSFLVELFDPVISPRCYGILSIKSN